MVLRSGWTIPEVVSLIKRAKNDVVVVVGEIDPFNRDVLSSVCRSLDKMVLFGEEYVDKFSIDERLETVEQSPPVRHCDVAVLEESVPLEGKLLLDVRADEETIEEILREVRRRFDRVCRYERHVTADAYLVVDRKEGRVKLYARRDSDKLRELSMEIARKVAERRGREPSLRRIALVTTAASVLVCLGLLLSSGLLLSNLHHIP